MADVVYRAEFDFNVIGELSAGGGETEETSEGGTQPSQPTETDKSKAGKFIAKSLKGLAVDTAMQVATTGINSYGSTISYATGNSYQQEKFQWGANIVKTMGTGVVAGAAAGALMGSVIPGVGTAVGAGVGAAIGAISGGISIASSAYQAELKAAFQREIDLMHLRQIRKVTGLSSMNNSRMISSSSLY